MCRAFSGLAMKAMLSGYYCSHARRLVWCRWRCFLEVWLPLAVSRFHSRAGSAMRRGDSMRELQLHWSDVASANIEMRWLPYMS